MEFLDPRFLRGRRWFAEDPTRRGQAARAARAAPTCARPPGFGPSADRGDLGRRGSGDCAEERAGVRLPAAQGNRAGGLVTRDGGYALIVEPNEIDIDQLREPRARRWRRFSAGCFGATSTGPRAVPRRAARRLQPRAMGSRGDRTARGTSPRRARSTHRCGPRVRDATGSSCPSSKGSRLVTLRRTSDRAADARPLPVGPSG